MLEQAHKAIANNTRLRQACNFIKRPAYISFPRLLLVRHGIGTAILKPHLNPEKGEGARAGLSRGDVGQRKHHVTPGLGLPEGVHDMTLALAHLQNKKKTQRRQT